MAVIWAQFKRVLRYHVLLFLWFHAILVVPTARKRAKMLKRITILLIVFLLILPILPTIIHQGSFLTLLLIHKLVIHAVIEICIIILLVDPILFTAFRAKFNYTPGCNQFYHFSGPLKWWIILLDFFDLIALVYKHALDRIEGGQDE